MWQFLTALWIWKKKAFKDLYDSLGLAMTFKDFLHIQNYFKNEGKEKSIHDRNPCFGYLLVRPLPSYDILYGTYGCDL